MVLVVNRLVNRCIKVFKIFKENHILFQATANAAEVKSLQAGDLEIKKTKAVAAIINRTEVDGLKTEEANAAMQVR